MATGIASWLGNAQNPRRTRLGLVGWLRTFLFISHSLYYLYCLCLLSPHDLTIISVQMYCTCILLLITHVSLILPSWLSVDLGSNTSIQNRHGSTFTAHWRTNFDHQRYMVPSAVCAAKADAKQVGYSAGLGSTTETCYDIVTCSRRPWANCSLLVAIKGHRKKVLITLA